jgi:hypothetical protein
MTPVRGQMPAPVLRGVIDEAHLADLRMRNEARAAELIKQMGPKWACHPQHSPRRAAPGTPA